VTLAKVTAPFTPFGAEAMYRNLVVGPRVAGARESVHLEDWPEPRAGAIDEKLSRKIATVRALASLGLQVRNHAKIKVRQPLRVAHVVTAQREGLDSDAQRQLAEELNVDEARLVPLEEADRYVQFRLKPSFRALGQRGLGKEAQVLKKTMAGLASGEAAAAAARLMAGATVTFDAIDLTQGDVEIEFVAKEGFAAAGDRAGVVVLDTRLDDALRDRGLVSELVNRVQAIRKDMSLEYTDRIRVWLAGSERMQAVVKKHGDDIGAEVLAVEVSTAAASPSGDIREIEVEGEAVRIIVSRA
jgi:isoleucyl-tRNA synthetase